MFSPLVLLLFIYLFIFMTVFKVLTFLISVNLIVKYQSGDQLRCK